MRIFFGLLALAFCFSQNVSANYYSSLSYSCGTSNLLGYRTGGEYGRILKKTYSCPTATFYASNTAARQVYLRIEGLYLCQGSTLTIYDGSSTADRVLLSVSGTTSTTLYKKTTGPYFTFQYSASSSFCENGIDEFTIRYNTFRAYALCNSYEYECDDSGWCINSDLVCDGYKNCRDYDDEDDCVVDLGEILGITFGCVFFVIFLGVVCLLGLRRRRRRVIVVRTQQDNCHQHPHGSPNKGAPPTQPFYPQNQGYPPAYGSTTTGPPAGYASPANQGPPAGYAGPSPPAGYAGPNQGPPPGYASNNQGAPPGYESTTQGQPAGYNNQGYGN